MFQRPGTDDRKQTHHADIIKSDSGGDQGLDCGPVAFVIFPGSLTRDQMEYIHFS